MTTSKKEKAPVVRKENHTITYQFTKEELDQMSKQLASACKEKSKVEDEKKSAMSSFKYKLDGQDAIINLLSNHIAQGYEHRNVTCEVIYNFDKGVKEYYHEGIFYDQEKMKKEDYQLTIE